MDDGALSFDFEGYLHQQQQTQQQRQQFSNPSSSYQAPSDSRDYRKQANYRQTVCRHWLRGLCMKGDTCGYLHQYDESRLPVCRWFAKFGSCKEPDCPFKHSDEDVKDCNSFKLGFCVLGPRCQFRHLRLPRDQLPPVKPLLPD